MSEFLDEMARALGAPMPRSRVLRLLGGAMVATAWPGALRPARARGATTATGACPPAGYCPSSSVNCGVCPGRAPGSCYLAGCGQPGSTCCCLQAAGRPSGAVLCAPGYDCVPQGTEPCVCRKPCGGGTCCKPGEFCANPSLNLCCKDEERGCGPVCCQPNEECRTGRTGTGSVRVCTKRCPQGQAWCGKDKCCPPKWHCRNDATGRCARCRQSEEECGTKCCNRQTSRCCDKDVCCPKNRSCCAVKGPGSKKTCCPPRTKCRIPIQPGDIGVRPGARPICCPPERVNSNPDLCCPPGMVALNSPGFSIPPPGIPPDCCPPGQICRSQTGTKSCVDLRSDPRNCGSCGNVCASGICSNGICALP